MDVDWKGMACPHLQEALGNLAGDLIVLVVGDVLPFVLALEAQSAEVPILVQGLVEHAVHSVGGLRAAGVQAQTDSPIGLGRPQSLLCRDRMAWSAFFGCPQALSKAQASLKPCWCCLHCGYWAMDWQAVRAGAPWGLLAGGGGPGLKPQRVGIFPASSQLWYGLPAPGRGKDRASGAEGQNMEDHQTPDPACTVSSVNEQQSGLALLCSCLVYTKWVQRSPIDGQCGLDKLSSSPGPHTEELKPGCLMPRSHLGHHPGHHPGL